MFRKINENFQRDVKQLRRKYRLMKLKMFLLFVLPIFVLILAYKTAKQFLKIKLRGLVPGEGLVAGR